MRQGGAAAWSAVSAILYNPDIVAVYCHIPVILYHSHTLSLKQPLHTVTMAVLAQIHLVELDLEMPELNCAIGYLQIVWLLSACFFMSSKSSRLDIETMKSHAVALL